MGEKYDRGAGGEWSSSGGATRLLRDPSGPGFPPEHYADMRRGGEAGRVAVSNYLDRTSDTIEQSARRAGEQLQGAGSESAARVAAGEQAVATLDQGTEQLELQGAQSEMALSMLAHEPDVSGSDLATAAKDSARATVHVTREHLGLLDLIIEQVLERASDGAFESVAERAQAAAHRLRRAAHGHAESLAEVGRSGSGADGARGGPAA